MKAAGYIFTKAFFVALLIAGLSFGVAGDLNVATFYACVRLVTYFAMNADSCNSTLEGKRPPIPLAAVLAVDLMAAFFIVWFGAWALATVWSASTAFEISAWEKAMKKSEAAA
ncbi:hypothetical protein [Propionivibrio sp.]|uniref:hypothetical protein n=1 Tax=Propionivibrio sp. TaxID=2212460 RepID=UPI003BF2B34C